MVKKVAKAATKSEDTSVPVNVNIPASLKKAFRVKLAQDDLKQTQAIISLIEGYVSGKFRLTN